MTIGFVPRLAGSALAMSDTILPDAEPDISTDRGPLSVAHYQRLGRELGMR